MKKVLFCLLILLVSGSSSQELKPEQPTNIDLRDSLIQIQKQTKTLIEKLPQRPKVKRVKEYVPVPVYIHDTVYIHGSTILLVKSDTVYQQEKNKKKKKGFLRRIFK